MLSYVLAFLAGLAALVYTYVGYPLLLVVLTVVQDSNARDDLATCRADSTNSNSTPSDASTTMSTLHDAAESTQSVTMVVAAHNEEDVIEEKLENTRAIEYNGEFECIIVSDSTDRTDALVERHAGPSTRLLTLDERRGKSHALNRAVKKANGDVFVFSDANTMYEPDAVSELVAPLADESVGCTTGSLQLVDEDGSTTESAYWRYELKIRKLESQLGTTVSVNGGMLALRSEDYQHIPEQAFADDLIVALQQAAAGRRIVFAEDARGTEQTTGDLWNEYDRRVRIGAGNYQVLTWFHELLDPRNGVVALEFASHKALRWCMPAILLAVLVANVTIVLLAPSASTTALLGAQLACYGLAGVGMADERARSASALISLPAYFLSMNLAFAVGFRKFLSGPSIDDWKSTRGVEK